MVASTGNHWHPDTLPWPTCASKASLIDTLSVWTLLVTKISVCHQRVHWAFYVLCMQWFSLWSYSNWPFGIHRCKRFFIQVNIKRKNFLRNTTFFWTSVSFRSSLLWYSSQWVPGAWPSLSITDSWNQGGNGLQGPFLLFSIISFCEGNTRDL